MKRQVSACYAGFASAVPQHFDSCDCKDARSREVDLR